MAYDDAEPFPLMRRRDEIGLGERWFDAPDARASRTSIESSPPPPWRAPTARSVMAGIVTGAAGGFGLVASAALVGFAFDPEANVPHTLGTWVSGAALQGELATAAGFGSAVLVGAALAVLLSLATRHLRRGLPLLLFGVIFVPALWLAIDVLLLRRYAPTHEAGLPFGAMVVGAAVFGACFALLPKLRGGTTSRA
jgi:hypothetical protein